MWLQFVALVMLHLNLLCCIPSMDQEVVKLHVDCINVDVVNVDIINVDVVNFDVNVAVVDVDVINIDVFNVAGVSVSRKYFQLLVW